MEQIMIGLGLSILNSRNARPIWQSRISTCTIRLRRGVDPVLRCTKYGSLRRWAPLTTSRITLIMSSGMSRNWAWRIFKAMMNFSCSIMWKLARLSRSHRVIKIWTWPIAPNTSKVHISWHSWRKVSPSKATAMITLVVGAHCPSQNRAICRWKLKPIRNFSFRRCICYSTNNTWTWASSAYTTTIKLS